MVTTASGFFGGMTRVLVGRITLTAITLGSLMEVALYAGTSALVGYGVKIAIDQLKKFITRSHQKQGSMNKFLGIGILGATISEYSRKF